MLTSTLESAVPEQLFNTDPANPIDGISAVKALQLAAQQGQKIYQINPQNQATVLPQLTLSGLAMKEIRQGLAAGKEVIAHASQISVPGWTGEGYIITDPVTGSGAYKISGGGNGANTVLQRDFALMITAAAVGFIDAATSRLEKLTFLFSDNLKALKKYRNTAKLLGGVALLVSAVSILTDNKLTFAQKLGQASLGLLGFALTSVVAVGMLALVGSVGLAAVATFIIAALIALFTTIISTVYFSYYRNNITNPAKV